MQNQDIINLNKQIVSCDQSKPFVFVSYSKKDADKVYPTVIQLQQMGFNIWIDKELRNQIGEDWQMGALSAIASKPCKAILFFMSENSMWSAPVCAELIWSTSETARRYNRNEALKIIPINTSDLWNPSKEPTCNWIRDTLSDGGGEEPLAEDDYDVLRAAEVEEKYLDTKNISRYRYHSDIALHIQKAIFEPLGGNKVTIASLSDIETIQSNIPGETKSITVEKNTSTIERVKNEINLDRRNIENPEPDSHVKIAEVSNVKLESPINTSELHLAIDTKTSINGKTTLLEFGEMCLDVNFCLYLRNIRGAYKELYSKQIFDYVVVALLRGCDDKMLEGSAPWNYSVFTVAAKPDPENPVLGASQFTWQSNSRKAVGMTGSGKLGASSTYFKTLNPNLTLSEIQYNFDVIHSDAYKTKNNEMIRNVFKVLYGQI